MPHPVQLLCAIDITNFSDFFFFFFSSIAVDLFLICRGVTDYHTVKNTYCDMF